jgi:hypothetical protein
VIEVLMCTSLGLRIKERLFGGDELLNAPHLLDVEVLQVVRSLLLAGSLTGEGPGLPRRRGSLALTGAAASTCRQAAGPQRCLVYPRTATTVACPTSSSPSITAKHCPSFEPGNQHILFEHRAVLRNTTNIRWGPVEHGRAVDHMAAGAAAVFALVCWLICTG